MKIILHAYNKSELPNQLRALIQDKFGDIQIQMTNSQQHLFEGLCRPAHCFSVVIAFVDDSESVELLISLKPLFENIKLILIVSKNIEDTRKNLLRLEPLFTSHSENFTDIISVLQRIEQKQSWVISLSGIKQRTNV